MTLSRAGVVLLLIAAHAAPSAAQRGDSITTEVIAPGVTYRRIINPAGPWRINIVAVDLRQPGLSIRSAHADDHLRGFETVSAAARRVSSDAARVLVAINADFFSLKTGEGVNNQVVEGEIFKGVRVTDAPADSGRHVRSQFAITGSGRPLIEPFTFSGALVNRSGTVTTINAINHRARGSDVVLYTPRTGAITPWDSTGRTVEVKLRPITQSHDTTLYQVAGFPAAGGTTMLAGGVALSFPRDSRNIPAAGAIVRVATNLVPAPRGLRTVVGGGPRLVRHGRSIADSADALEGVFSKTFAGRNPRTGIGMSRDSTTLFLITVDGRQDGSVGMSLTEFADLMISLGIYEGLNLDGGGSTAMVVNGRLVNTPSDKDKAGQFVERAVGNVLLVMQARRD